MADCRFSAFANSPAFSLKSPTVQNSFLEAFNVFFFRSNR